MLLSVKCIDKQLCKKSLDIVEYTLCGKWKELQGHIIMILKKFFEEEESLDECTQERGLELLANYIQTNECRSLLVFLDKINFSQFFDYEDLLKDCHIPMGIEYQDPLKNNAAWIFYVIVINEY